MLLTPFKYQVELVTDKQTYRLPFFAREDHNAEGVIKFRHSLRPWLSEHSLVASYWPAPSIAVSITAQRYGGSPQEVLKQYIIQQLLSAQLIPAPFGYTYPCQLSYHERLEYIEYLNRFAKLHRLELALTDQFNSELWLTL